jgi:hypothetical protein
MVPRERSRQKVLARVDVRCSTSFRNVRTNSKVCASEGISTVAARDRVAVGARLYCIAPEPYLHAICARNVGVTQT